MGEKIYREVFTYIYIYLSMVLVPLTCLRGNGFLR